MLVLALLEDFIPIGLFTTLGQILYFPIEMVGLGDRDLQIRLTKIVFGRITPNRFPITVVLYFILWFLIILFIIQFMKVIEKLRAR